MLVKAHKRQAKFHRKEFFIFLTIELCYASQLICYFFACHLLIFFIFFPSKYSFRNTIRVSISLDLDHAHGFVSLRPGPEVIKLFSYATQLSMKFQLLIKTNEEVFCFKSLSCCIYHANKC